MGHSEPRNPDPDPRFCKISESEFVLVGSTLGTILSRDPRRTESIKSMVPTIVVLVHVCFLFFLPLTKFP